MAEETFKVATRREKDQQEVVRKMPANTRLIQQDGRDIWIFKKNTELKILFEIAVYYDPDERGYCAQLISPQVENSWKNAHVGHLFSDGIICMGFSEPSMRSRHTLLEAYAKACFWAEGMSVMIRSHELGTPMPFPFSDNNSPSEAYDARR